MFENKNQELTPISALGEFGLIKHLTQFFPVENASTELGVGDDAAIINAEGKKVLVSTDMFTEGVDFNLGYVPLKHLGYKVVVAGISDTVAMNAVPTHIMISVAVSNRFPCRGFGRNLCRSSAGMQTIQGGFSRWRYY